MRLKYPLRSFTTGLVLSSGAAFFFYLGISLSYTYLSESLISLLGLTLLCSLIFWLKGKCDHMFDIVDVFSKTVSLDLKSGQPGVYRFLFFLRPVYPYIIASGALMMLLWVLWSVPALIMYWFVQPHSPGTSLGFIVYFMSVGSGILYYLSNKDQFPTLSHRITFFAGVLFAPAGAVKILSNW